MATDGHAVDPLFFPGGDIGSLAVHGTVNDVAMMGAMPMALTASFILEEGLKLADLRRIVGSMGRAAREAGVPVVAGDTKVVQRGKGDGVFIATTGLGTLPAGRELSAARVRAIAEVVNGLIRAVQEGRDVDLNDLKGDVSREQQTRGGGGGGCRRVVTCVHLRAFRRAAVCAVC